MQPSISIMPGALLPLCLAMDSASHQDPPLSCFAPWAVQKRAQGTDHLEGNITTNSHCSQEPVTPLCQACGQPVGSSSVKDYKIKGVGRKKIPLATSSSLPGIPQKQEMEVLQEQEPSRLNS